MVENGVIEGSYSGQVRRNLGLMISCIVCKWIMQVRVITAYHPRSGIHPEELLVLEEYLSYFEQQRTRRNSSTFG